MTIEFNTKNMTKILQDDFARLEQESLCQVNSDELIDVKGGKLPFGEQYFRWRNMKRICAEDKSAEIFLVDTMRGLSGTRRLVLFRNNHETAYAVILAYA